MASDRFEKVGAAAMLPVQWNELTEYYFQQKEFLQHTDVCNPCNQRYYLLWNSHELIAGACVYTLYIHLFTFSGIPSRKKMQVIGVPASISSPGVIGRSEKDIEKLIQYIIEIEKGLLLTLNITQRLQLESCIEMTMMPTVVVNDTFSSWKGYLNTLRSPYRRRANHIVNGFQQVEEISTRCDVFTEVHYALYLQIMRHTREKLETLSFQFFKTLPSCFQLTSYYEGSQLLCWHITCSDKENLFFFFGGHDYELLDKYQSYFNNLFGIVRQFINEGYQKLDLGQTAEIAKMKVGGQMETRTMFLYHHNPFIRFILRILKPIITYHSPKLVVHPFRKMHVIHQPKIDRHENITRQAAAIT